MAERYAFTASLLEVILLGFYHHSLFLIFPAFLQVTPRRNRLHIFRLPQVAHNSKLCRCRVLVAGPDSAVLPGLQNMLPSATKAKNAQQWALFVPLWSQLSTRRRSSRSRPRLAVFRGEKHRTFAPLSSVLPRSRSVAPSATCGPQLKTLPPQSFGRRPRLAVFCNRKHRSARHKAQNAQQCAFCALWPREESLLTGAVHLVDFFFMHSTRKNAHKVFDSSSQSFPNSARSHSYTKTARRRIV